MQLGAFAASEADAGSDVGGYRTRAVYDEAGDEWVINGTKAWITNGGIADVHVVVAVVDPELKARGHASFIVPPGTPGLSQGQKYKKHGIRASHTAEVVLDDVRVPGRCLLGGKEKLDERLARVREGKPGNSQAAMQTFEATRPAVAAQAIGVARAAYEYSLDYAKERRAFGRAIIENQSIAFMLADMATEIDASRLLTWRAAWTGKNAKFENAEGSMAKLKAARTATWVTERAMQILGGAGYVRDHPVERWHRDAKIHDIFEGTEQIQQLVIARAISGLRIECSDLGLACDPVRWIPADVDLGRIGHVDATRTNAVKLSLRLGSHIGCHCVRPVGGGPPASGGAPLAGPRQAPTFGSCTRRRGRRRE